MRSGVESREGEGGARIVEVRGRTEGCCCGVLQGAGASRQPSACRCALEMDCAVDVDIDVDVDVDVVIVDI